MAWMKPGAPHRNTRRRTKMRKKYSGGLKTSFKHARPFPGGDALLRLEPRVKNFLGHLRVEPQAALVAQQPARHIADFALDDETLVHQHVLVETRALPADQPQDRIGPHRGRRRRRLAVKRQHARQPPAPDLGRRLQQPRQFGAQIGVEPFVGVDAEHPVFARLLQCKLLLFRVARPVAPVQHDGKTPFGKILRRWPGCGRSIRNRPR